MRYARWTAAILLGLGLGSPSGATSILGVDTSNPYPRLWRIDGETGDVVEGPQITGLGLQRYEFLLDIDQEPSSGLVYGLTTRGNLFTIDPNSGISRGIGTNANFVSEGDISFNPKDGRLYALGRDNQCCGPYYFKLFTLSLTDGTATPIASLDPTAPGPNSFFDLSGLAFDQEGGLFALDTASSRFLTIDPITGDILRITDAHYEDGVSANLGASIAGFDYDSASNRFITRTSSQLFAADPRTGLVVEVGAASSLSVAGLAVIPEPTTVALMGLGLAALAGPLSRRG